MKTFSDVTGKKWNIVLNLGNARRVKSETDVDLINSIKFDENGMKTDDLTKLSEDPYTLISVIYSLCGCSDENEKLSPEEFEQRFDMDVIENAVDCLLSEIIDFFPHAKRNVLKAIYEKSSRFRREEEKKLDEYLASESFQRGLESQLSSSRLNLQELSESTQTSSQSDS